MSAVSPLVATWARAGSPSCRHILIHLAPPDRHRDPGGTRPANAVGGNRTRFRSVPKWMVTLVDSQKTTNDTRFDQHVMPELEVLYRTAWSLTRSDADAQDLVQDTLLRAYRSIDRFDGRYPRAWLLTIMRNANINRARKKKPDLLNDPDLTFERSREFADHDDPESLVVSPVLDAAIEDAFSGLSDDFREVVELVDLDGLAYQEAANVLDVPVGTVMSRLHRARRRIREHLEETGLDQEVRTR